MFNRNFDKNVIENWLMFFYDLTSMPEDERRKQTIANLVDIADILCNKMRVSNMATLQHDLNMICYYAKSQLSEVMYGEYSDKYTQRLKDLLLNEHYQRFIMDQFNEQKEMAISHRDEIFQQIPKLLELEISESPISDIEYLKDYLASSYVLQDQEVFSRQMTHLENELQSHAKKLNAKLVLNRNMMFELPPAQSDKTFSRQKILSSFLYKWAQENGFNQDYYANIKKFLSPEDFLRLVADKVVFKDSGADSYHSYFPHLLQTYILAEENKVHPFLKHSVPDFYQFIAGFKNQTRPFDWKGEYLGGALWDYIFDRDARMMSDDFDYRCGENITQRLIQDAKIANPDEKRWPILSESVKRGSEKEKSNHRINQSQDIIYIPYKKK